MNKTEEKVCYTVLNQLQQPQLQKRDWKILAITTNLQLLCQIVITCMDNISNRLHHWT